MPVVDFPDLRPTGDRVRETLFNWLAPVIVESRCLDLFAGSGVLGLESASRGASEVVLVDRSREIAALLARQVERLQHRGLTVACDDAVHWLNTRNDRPFDIVFLDPPFGYGMIEALCACLEENGSVRAGGYIYLEQDKHSLAPGLPPNWAITHEKKAGRVRYYLARRF